MTTTSVHKGIFQVRGSDCYHYNSTILPHIKSVTGNTINTSQEAKATYINGSIFVADPTYHDLKISCCVEACSCVAFSIIACPVTMAEYASCVPCHAIQIFCPTDCSPHDDCYGSLVKDAPRPNTVDFSQPYKTLGECLGDYGASAVSRWIGKCFDCCSLRVRTYSSINNIDTMAQKTDLENLGIDLNDNESMKSFMSQKNGEVIRYKKSEFLPFKLPTLKATAILFDPKGNKTNIRMVFICNKKGEQCKNDHELIITAQAYIDLVHQETAVSEEPKIHEKTPLLPSSNLS